MNKARTITLTAEGYRVIALSSFAKPEQRVRAWKKYRELSRTERVLLKLAASRTLTGGAK